MAHNVIAELKEAFKDSFMQPEAYLGIDIEEALIESGLDYEEAGIYVRLSAGGYLDCTDWQGPFETIEEGAQALLDSFAD